MKRSRAVRTTAVLAGATALGIGAGSAAFALWNDDDAYASSVRTGSLSLNIADTPAGTGKVEWAAPNGGPITFGLPDGTGSRAANPLAGLTASTPVAVPFAVQSKAYGRWGVDYSLSGLTINGADKSLAQAATLKVFTNVAAADCKASLTGTPAYSGALTGFTGLSNQVGVKGVKSEERTDTDSYCLVLSVPAGTGEHTNKVTVEGGSVNGTTLGGSATWSATEGDVPSNSPARQATLSLKVTVTRTGGA